MLSKPEVRAAAREEWRRGWLLVLASIAGMSLGPLMTYTMGIFVAPIEAEYGWSRSVIVSGLTINSVMVVFLAPFFGALIDRFGPRTLAIPGVVLFTGAFALLSTVTDSPLHWWGLWVLVGLAATMVKPTVWTYAIVSRFREARGLALAIALSGTALTGLFAPVFANMVIQSAGWRWAYVAIGVVYLILALPLVVLFFYSSFEKSRRDRLNGAEAEMPTGAPLTGLTVRDALHSATFWKIAMATFLAMFPISGLVVHLVSVLTQGGLDRSGAVAAASSVGLAAVIGRLLAGVLLDRTNARFLAGIAFLLPGVACLLLIGFGGGLVTALSIGVLLGICTGAELEMSSYLSSRHFGMRNFGALFGFVAGLIGLASGLAPVLGGIAFDTTGSYYYALLGGAVFAIVASGLIFALPPYPESFPAEAAALA